MSERNVSDLIFRDIEPGVAADRAGAEREAALREALGKLRPLESGPRVVPAAQATDRAGERER